MPCSIGAVSYAYLDEDGNARRDVLYCYDLELPADFTPRPVDGEVERFDLRPVEWVVEKVVEGMEYKPNCNLVLIDFYGFLELTGAETFKVSDWDITGMSFTFLAWETVVFFVSAILVDYMANSPRIKGICLGETIPSGIDSSKGKDEDVLNEEERVRQGNGTEEDVILVNDLKKVYSTGKYAVKGVSLGIPKGECFGLLGINGAGKSSTLRYSS